MRRTLYKTDIELIMFDALTERKIVFVFQYPIRCRYGYITDFFIPQHKLIIECDGEHWHNKQRDNKRDAVLLKKGYNIIRFSGKEIKKDINLCLTKIEQEVNKNGKD